MKKQTLLLLAGGLLAFASCNNNAPATGGMSQEQIDSTVNARVDAIRTELTAQNDSLINAMAQAKADSMIATMKGGAPAPRPASKPSKSKPSTTESKPSEPVSTNPKDARFNGTESKHNKDARFNQDAAKQDAAKKKEDRFK